MISVFCISYTSLSIISCEKETYHLKNHQRENNAIQTKVNDGDEFNSKTINYKGIGEYAGSKASKISNSINIGSSNVKIYSRDVSDIENHVVFKYGDLINRAISYKENHPNTNVNIKFAIYKIGDKSYVVFDPNHPKYGSVYGNDEAGASSEKLIFSLVKAARRKVNIDFLYHKDNLDNSNSCKADRSDNVLNYLTTRIEPSDSTDIDIPGNRELVSDYLTVTRVDWEYSAHEQMHSKFMTVSHYDDGSTGKHNTVYVSTSNVDDHIGSIPDGKDWVHSGALVNSNQGLFNAHNNYFDIIKGNHTSHASFVSAVRNQHATNNLNYDDGNFCAYFFPIPNSPSGNYTPELTDWDSSNANGWDTQYNPFAKYADSLSVSRHGGRYIKGNIYHMKWDNFNKAFRNKLEDEYVNRNTSHTTSFKFLVSTNSNADNDTSNNTTIPGKCKSIKDNYGDGILKLKNGFSGANATIRNQNNDVVDLDKASGVKTHSKDMIFAFSQHSRYVSITGSTNFKLDAVTSKANHSLVIREFTTLHPVYNEFKKIFEYQY